MEGWEAWDVALRCAGQLRTAQFVAVGIDMNAALQIAQARGYEISSVADLMPACESGMVTAINEKLSKGAK